MSQVYSSLPDAEVAEAEAIVVSTTDGSAFEAPVDGRLRA